MSTILLWKATATLFATCLISLFAKVKPFRHTRPIGRMRNDFLGSGPVFLPLRRHIDAHTLWDDNVPTTSISKKIVPGVHISSRQMRALQAAIGVAQGWTKMLSIGASMGVAQHDDDDDDDDGPPTGVLGVRSLFKTEYIGSLGVGTVEGKPEVELYAIYDTGSSDLWVASDLCQHWPCTGIGRHRYNHTRSETFHRPAQEQKLITTYGSGELHGMLGIDDVRIGPLLSQGQKFGLITEEFGNSFRELPFDGIVGLGFPALAAEGSVPFFDNLIAHGVLPKHEFAFYFHCDPERGGAILWGGIDHRLYEGPLVRFPVTEEAYWALDFVAFRVGNSVFNFTNADDNATILSPILIVDSGTTFFTAENQIYRAIMDSISPLSCTRIESLPSLVYTLRNIQGELVDVVVPPHEYMVRSDFSDSLCIPGIVDLPVMLGDKPIMILGELFMRHYFVVFNRGNGGGPHVSIAPARYDANVDAFLNGK